MRRFLVAALLVVLGRGAARACEPMSYQPDDILTNEPVFSNNHRYLAIERWYEGLKDFESARADTIMNFDPLAPDDDPQPKERRKTITFAVYEADTRTLLSEFSIQTTLQSPAKRGSKARCGSTLSSPNTAR